MLLTGALNKSVGSPLAKKILKRPLGSPHKSPLKKLSISNITKSPGKSPLKEGGKDTPFSSKVFKEWRAKFASKDQNGYHCLVCPKSFSLDSSLKRHYKNVHELVCKCCSMQFAEEHLLKAHHKEKHEYWCFPCNKVFTLRSSLIRHNVQQHGAESPRKQEKGFNVKSEPGETTVFQNAPKGIDFNALDPNVVIPPIDIDYQGLTHEDIAESVLQDESSDTTEKEIAPSNYFENGFNSTGNFADSAGTDNPEETSTLSSLTNDIKPNMAFNAGDEEDQKQQQKRGDGEYPCPECDKMFSNKGNMNRHYNSTHVFPCKVCKQKFVEKQLMEAHYFEEHVMHCPICKKTFSNKGNLNRHMKQNHDQELPKDYKEPTLQKPMKQGTPTKQKQQGPSKMSSPQIKQEHSRLNTNHSNQQVPLQQVMPNPLLGLPTQQRQHNPGYAQQLALNSMAMNNPRVQIPRIDQFHLMMRQQGFFKVEPPQNSIPGESASPPSSGWAAAPQNTGNGWGHQM